MPSPLLSLAQSRIAMRSIFFFFNDTATTEIYTLSLHDALPISLPRITSLGAGRASSPRHRRRSSSGSVSTSLRSEEHTSELQSQSNLVCRLLLEKKKDSPDRPVERGER